MPGNEPKSFLGIAIGTALGGILLLQLVNLSFLADTGNVGTVFVVAFIALGTGFCFLVRDRLLVFSLAHGLALGGWLLLLAGSFQAANAGWALLMCGVAGVYLLCFFLVTNYARRCPPFTEWVIDALLLFGLLGALAGLYEFVHFHTCGISLSPLIPWILPPDVNPRIGGPYGQANLFALFLTLVQIAYVYRHLHGFRSELGSWASRLRFLPLLTVATVFFLTYSRGGLISWTLIIGVLTWLVATGRYLGGQSNARREFFLLLLCLGLAFLLSQIDLSRPSGGTSAAIRLLAEETGSNQNTSGRFVFWTSAILIFLDHPWLGVGLDNYRFLMTGYGPTSHGILGFVEYEAMMSTFWAHNEYLQLLCEGGVFLFAVILISVVIFARKLWRCFNDTSSRREPFFLYGHLFLLPFLVQSLFEWPLRHPALLLLFVTFAGILAAQYRLRPLKLVAPARFAAAGCILLGVAVTGVLYSQELQIMDFKRAWLTEPIEMTISEFEVLADRPYSSYRILRNTLPRYTAEALRRENDSLANALLPHSKKLVKLEGAAGQWYDLARLYLRLDRLEDARAAIREAFELKPTDTVIFEFLHHLNVIKASRATGRPVASFYPAGLTPVDINFQELQHD